MLSKHLDFQKSKLQTKYLQKRMKYNLVISYNNFFKSYNGEEKRIHLIYQEYPSKLPFRIYGKTSRTKSCLDWSYRDGTDMPRIIIDKTQVSYILKGAANLLRVILIVEYYMHTMYMYSALLIPRKNTGLLQINSFIAHAICSQYFRILHGSALLCILIIKNCYYKATI